MQLVFGVCAPEYGAIQKPAVGKAVRQTGNIYRAPRLKVVCRQLNLFIPLTEDCRTGQRVDVLLSFAKVNRLGAVLGDKMRLRLVPVVLVIAEGEAVFRPARKPAGKYAPDTGVRSARLRRLSRRREQ